MQERASSIHLGLYIILISQRRVEAMAVQRQRLLLSHVVPLACDNFDCWMVDS